MSNLPLAFIDLLGGGILIAAGLYKANPGDVINGRLPAGLPGFAAPASSTSSGANVSQTNAAARGSNPSVGKGSIWDQIFGPGHKISLSRHDQGRDAEGPANSPVYATGNGHVIAVPSNPGGFGIAYPVIHFDTGPWAGKDVYFGHIKALVSSGASVAAGQIIGETQNGSGPYVGNATGMPGHIEIGLWPPGPFGNALPAGL